MRMAWIGLLVFLAVLAGMGFLVGRWVHGTPGEGSVGGPIGEVLASALTYPGNPDMCEILGIDPQLLVATDSTSFRLGYGTRIREVRTSEEHLFLIDARAGRIVKYGVIGREATPDGLTKEDAIEVSAALDTTSRLLHALGELAEPTRECLERRQPAIRYRDSRTIEPGDLLGATWEVDVPRQHEGVECISILTIEVSAYSGKIDSLTDVGVEPPKSLEPKVSESDAIGAARRIAAWKGLGADYEEAASLVVADTAAMPPITAGNWVRFGVAMVRKALGANVSRLCWRVSMTCDEPGDMVHECVVCVDARSGKVLGGIGATMPKEPDRMATAGSREEGDSAESIERQEPLEHGGDLDDKEVPAQYAEFRDDTLGSYLERLGFRDKLAPVVEFLGGDLSLPLDFRRGTADTVLQPGGDNRIRTTDARVYIMDGTTGDLTGFGFMAVERPRPGLSRADIISKEDARAAANGLLEVLGLPDRIPEELGWYENVFGPQNDEVAAGDTWRFRKNLYYGDIKTMGLIDISISYSGIVDSFKYDPVRLPEKIERNISSDEADAIARDFARAQGIDLGELVEDPGCMIWPREDTWATPGEQGEGFDPTHGLGYNVRDLCVMWRLWYEIPRTKPQQDMLFMVDCGTGEIVGGCRPRPAGEYFRMMQAEKKRRRAEEEMPPPPGAATHGAAGH